MTPTRLHILSLVAGAALMAPGHAVAADEAESTGVKNARQAFLTAPMMEIPTIPLAMRMDMADYFDAGMAERAGTNLMGGDIKIIALTDTMVQLQEGEATRLDIAMLPTRKGDDVIMMIQTLDTPVPDSSLRFFSSGWQPLQLFTEPGMEQWIIGKPSRELREDIPFALFTAAYSPATGILTLTNHTADSLSRELKEKYESRLIAQMQYQWDGSRFTLLKK